MSLTYVPCIHCRKINRFPVEEAQTKEPICGNCKNSLPFHMGVSELTVAGLQLLVQKSPLPVLTDFWAPWCGPCKAFAPTFLRAAKDFAGKVVFAKVNTEANPLAGDSYQIRSIPTLVYFQNGLEKDRQSGAIPAEALEQWLQQQLSP